jgi:hypothetical protein
VKSVKNFRHVEKTSAESQNKDQYQKGRSAVQRVCVFFMQKYAVYWPEGGAASQYSVFIGQKMSLTG